MSDTVTATANMLRRAGGVLLDLLLPPQCLTCAAAVDVPGRLCAECWEGVAFIAPPYCDACGFPFEYDVGQSEGGGEIICGACMRDRPAWGRARAVMRYDEDSRALVLGFKHGDRTHGATAFGQWMARAGAGIVADADLVAPVPLHWTRLFRRRYNQSALLAQAVAGAADLPFAPELLRRTRRTASQGLLSREARGRNVRGAFTVDPKRRDMLRGRRVLLVDDVLTSGATAQACTKALLRAGAAGVDVLVLARAGRGGGLDR